MSKCEAVSTYTVCDGDKYFKENAGNDKKLSWEEIQNAPLKCQQKTRKCPKGPGANCGINGYEFYEIVDVEIKVGESVFEKVKDTEYDGDPNKLNLREFWDMLSYMDVYEYWEDEDLCHCVEGIFNKSEEKKVRTGIRNGVASALKDSWPTRKKKINQAIEEGKLEEVVGLLNKYLSAVATTARHYSLETVFIEDICKTLCLTELYEIEEMASKKSLKNKTIRNFWDDVADIFTQVLNKAKEQGIPIRDIFDVKWDRNEIPYYDDYDDDHIPRSDFTLMSLMEKANPEVTKEIAAAINESKSKD